MAELSRLGRSILECMEIPALATRRGIRVYSVKGMATVDHSIQSKILALALLMAVEIERDLISQRTKEALRFKKGQGLTLAARNGRARASWRHPPGNRGPVGQRLDTEIRRTAYHTTEVNLHNWLEKHRMKTVKAA